MKIQTDIMKTVHAKKKYAATHRKRLKNEAAKNSSKQSILRGKINIVKENKLPFREENRKEFTDLSRRISRNVSFDLGSQICCVTVLTISKNTGSLSLTLYPSVDFKDSIMSLTIVGKYFPMDSSST